MDKREPKETVAVGLAVVIIGVWAIAAARAIADVNYDMPDFLTPLMGGVSTWCFVGDVVRKVRGGPREDDETETQQRNS